MSMPTAGLEHIERMIPGTRVVLEPVRARQLERLILIFPAATPENRAMSLVSYLCRYTDFVFERMFWDKGDAGLAARGAWLLREL